jgi:signal transduction histidine kinase
VASLEDELAETEGFAAQAAHELLTPLLMTETFADIVADRLKGGEHAQSRSDLQAVGRNAARTRRTVEGLLREATRAGRPPRFERVDLDVIARDVVAMLGPEQEHRQARIEIGRLPLVSGEPDLLGAVLVNLLVNALKYNPRRGGVIHVHGERADGWCAIHVDDEAPQLPEDERERIFEAYHRGRRERRVRGAGLGLTICRRIVERHGGTIAVGPAPGGGNRFTFTVPAA